MGAARRGRAIAAHPLQVLQHLGVLLRQHLLRQAELGEPLPQQLAGRRLVAAKRIEIALGHAEFSGDLVELRIVNATQFGNPRDADGQVLDPLDQLSEQREIVKRF